MRVVTGLTTYHIINKIRVAESLHFSLWCQIAQKKYSKFHCANIPISL